MDKDGTESTPIGIYSEWIVIALCIGYVLYNMFKEIQDGFEENQEQGPMILPIGDYGIFDEEIAEELAHLMQEDGSAHRDYLGTIIEEENE